MRYFTRKLELVSGIFWVIVDFKLTKINRSFPAIREKKVYNFSFTKIGIKEKTTNEWTNRNSDSQGPTKIWSTRYIKSHRNRNKQWKDIKHAKKI